MKQKRSTLVTICDRCGYSYKRNSKFKCWGPNNKKNSVPIATGFSLIGMRSYPINYRDLCDNCIEDLIKWYGKAEDLTERYSKKRCGE